MHESPGLRRLLLALVLIYAVARLLQIAPTRLPALLIVLLHVVPPALFALLHGWRLYGARGILVFSAACLGCGTFFELLSLRTGFPFGHDAFTSVMGPKIFGLPVLLALAYLGIGYVSWVLSSTILVAPPRSRMAIFARPLLAACIMTAWDLAMDPVWATVDRAWIWRDGGAWFGVPAGNYFGWMLTTWTFYQVFALWLRGRESAQPPPPSSRLAILLYAVCAAGNLLLLFPSALPSVVPAATVDAAGRRWLAADTIRASALVSVLVMAPFALIAWARTANEVESATPDQARSAARSGGVPV